MTCWPIVERELRRAARRRGSFLLRGVVALLTSVFAALLLLVGYASPINLFGASVFNGLSLVCFVYCLLEGLRGADVISEETREGTLGLLFLTGLRARDVVLGKMATLAVRSGQGLLAFLPVLAVALVLGGVTLGEFWRAVLVFMGTLWLAISVGLAASALSRESHLALIRAGAVLLFLTLAPALVFDPFLPGASEMWISAFSPATAFRHIDPLAYRLRPWLYWQSIIGIGLLGLLALGMAAMASARAVRAEGEQAGERESMRGWIVFSRKRRRNQEKSHASWRTAALDHNPIFWFAMRRPRAGWLPFGLAALPPMVLGMGVIAGVPLERFGALRSTNLFLGEVFVVWLAWRSVRLAADLRAHGGLELLLPTPARFETIIRGHWLATNRFFGPALILYGLSLLLGHFPWNELRLGGFSPQGWMIPGPPAMLWWSGGVFYQSLKIALALLAMFWLGLRFGLTTPKTVPAFFLTLGVGWLGPMLLFCLPNPLLHLIVFAWARSSVERDFYRWAAGEHLFARMAPPRPDGRRVLIPPVLPPPAPPGR